MKLSARAMQPRKERINRVDILIGDSGIGKSTVLGLLADRLADKTGKPWRSKLWHVGTQGFEDITGMPEIEQVDVRNGAPSTHAQRISELEIMLYKAKNAKERDALNTQLAELRAEQAAYIRPVSRFAKADHVPGAVHWPEGYTLGIVDELPTASPQVQNIFREIVDGQLNGEPVDPNCVYVATGNPPDPRFVTVNALDEAIEKRLKVYVVVPTASELLDVWANRMPSLIYKFLLMNQAFIRDLAPREWSGVARDVQDVYDGSGSLKLALDEASDELRYNHPSIDARLRKFVEYGDDPHYYPILGRDLLDADEKQHEEHMAVVKYWLEKDQRGFVGETNNDLIRAVRTLSTSELPADGGEAYSRNAADFLVMLSEHNCNDMVMTVLDLALHAKVMGKAIERIKGSPTTLKKLADMINSASAAEKKRQEAKQKKEKEPAHA